MIRFSNVVREVLKQPVTEIFYCVKIADNFQETTYFSNISLDTPDGPLVYENTGLLLSVEPLVMDSVVDDVSYKITLADPFMETGAELSSTWIGKEAEVRLGFVNIYEANFAESGIPLNHPFTQIHDTLVVYAGVIESTVYQLKAEERGESLAVLNCSSPMYNLDFKKSLRLNRNSVRSKYPQDSCCDNVSGGSAILRLLWGKSS
jgi:hypothetical protein